MTCLGAVVALGLLSRRFPLPGLLAEYTGDALYATAAYCAFALLLPAASPSLLGGLAWLGSALVECTQLIHWQWLTEIRATRVGALLLGQGWQLADLLAYAIGALLAVATDVAMRWGRASPT